MNSINIGDRVGLDWVKGHGNAKVLSIYGNYATVIHFTASKPFVVSLSRLCPPEESPKTGFILTNMKANWAWDIW